jgi:hypothetical protein
MKHYFHDIDWPEGELASVDAVFKSVGSEYSIDAAIGEGAGGIGIEDIVEFVFLATASGIAWDITKATLKKIVSKLVDTPPKDKVIPEPLNEQMDKQPYNLVVHLDNTVVGIDLRQDKDSILLALDDIDKEFGKPTFRIDYADGGWARYDNEDH